jgi:dsRNA-specific ribonuclease
MEVIHEGKMIGQGSASTKKQAEQFAARASILHFQA